MEIKFQSELTTVNYMEEVGKFVDTLNKLAAQNGVNLILVLAGTQLSFIDGGKLDGVQRQTSKKFVCIDLKMWAQEGGEMVGFMISNTARYGLLSHDLFNKIKTGGKGRKILIGA